jgi:hypothetical protein
MLIFNEDVIQKLGNELVDIWKPTKKGALYHAVQLLARILDKKVDQAVLNSINIKENATFEEDDRVLMGLGFPKDFLFKKGGITESKLREKVEHLFLAAAGYILLGVENQVSEPVKQANLAQPSVQPSPLRLSLVALALVLKGSELTTIQQGPILSTMTVSLLDKASYFLCVSQQRVDEILNELSFEANLVDRDSQQQVLVVIKFQHASPMPQGKHFANRLELTQFLRNGGKSFEVSVIRTLAKLGDLSKAGFVRS